MSVNEYECECDGGPTETEQGKAGTGYTTQMTRTPRGKSNAQILDGFANFIYLFQPCRLATQDTHLTDPHLTRNSLVPGEILAFAHSCLALAELKGCVPGDVIADLLRGEQPSLKAASTDSSAWPSFLAPLTQAVYARQRAAQWGQWARPQHGGKQKLQPGKKTSCSR